jgi:hypothetical protein
MQVQSDDGGRDVCRFLAVSSMKASAGSKEVAFCDLFPRHPQSSKVAVLPEIVGTLLDQGAEIIGAAH